MTLVALAAALVLGVTAPTHTPRVNQNLPYTVRATLGGKPAHGRITVQIVDPIGSAHAVQYRNTKRDIVDFPFAGTFRDFVSLPPESQGFRVTLRVTVKAGGQRKTVDYWLRGR